MKLKSSFLIFALFFFGFLTDALAGKIYIDITSVSDRSFPIALVAPSRDGGENDAKNLNEQFVQVVRQDLELMGAFRFIEKGSFLEGSNQTSYKDSEIDFANWAVLDALALVKGWYRVQGSKLTVEGHLFDVLSKKEIAAKKYEGLVEELPTMAHRFANVIVQTLTGEPGLFETKIAFIGQKGGVKELYVMDFNGTNLRQLTHHNSIVLSPNWSKDGKFIYYTAFPKGKGAQLFKYDLKSDKSAPKTNFPGMVIGLRLDPVSDLLATTLTKDGNPEIYLLTAAGAESTRLTNNPDIDVSPTFSPDGRQIAFVSNRQGSAQIYRMDRSGGNTQRLTFKGNNNTSPAWSPKGDKIAFAGMDDDGQFDILSMTQDGGDMLRLTYDTRNNEDPSWAPDGQMLTFASSRTGQYQLYIMRPDGKKQVQLTRDSFKHTMPAWGPKPR